MPYMNCPRCGLSIRIRAAYLTVDWCPRCLARAGTAIPMQSSDQRPGRSASAEARPASAGRGGGGKPARPPGPRFVTEWSE